MVIKIPVDCRISYNQSLKVDQTMLTGELEPVDSTVEAAADPNALEPIGNTVHSCSVRGK